MILHIDTTETRECVSLFRKDVIPAKAGIYKEISWEGKRDETEKLLPAILRLLKKTKKSWGIIKGISVNPGPGGFSALRIGVTVANTLAFALGVPLYEFAGKKLRKVKVAIPRYSIPPNITMPTK